MTQFDLNPLAGVRANVLAKELLEAEQSLGHPIRVRVQILSGYLCLAKWPDVHRVYDLTTGTGFTFDHHTDGSDWQVEASLFAHRLRHLHSSQAGLTH